MIPAQMGKRFLLFIFVLQTIIVTISIEFGTAGNYFDGYSFIDFCLDMCANFQLQTASAH